MTVSLDDYLKKLSPERRACIEARTKKLVAQEAKSRRLRRELKHRP